MKGLLGVAWYGGGGGVAGDNTIVTACCRRKHRRLQIFIEAYLRIVLAFLCGRRAAAVAVSARSCLQRPRQQGSQRTAGGCHLLSSDVIVNN
jgi:hypothetical protein